MNWTSLNFGKHEGKTLPQVLWSDPDWFFWAVESNVFDKRPSLKSEASDLSSKARRIKIPDGIEDDPEVEYLVHIPSEKFGTFYIVNADKPVHQGSSPAYRQIVIDLTIPRSIANYDKTGYKLFLQSLKFYIFGSSSARITKKRAEDFYSEPANFA